MKVPICSSVLVADAERMARGLGCGLVVEYGRAFLVSSAPADLPAEGDPVGYEAAMPQEVM